MIGGFLAFLAVGLGGMWISACLRFATTGEIPAGSPLEAVHQRYGYDFRLLQEVIDINQDQTAHFVRRLETRWGTGRRPLQTQEGAA